jgi:hypothetical protein
VIARGIGMVAGAIEVFDNSMFSEAVEWTLCQHGATLDVCPVKLVTNLDPYRAAVIGSAVRYGTWIPEAIPFVDYHGKLCGLCRHHCSPYTSTSETTACKAARAGNITRRSRNQVTRRYVLTKLILIVLGLVIAIGVVVLWQAQRYWNEKTDDLQRRLAAAAPKGVT